MLALLGEGLVSARLVDPDLLCPFPVPPGWELIRLHGGRHHGTALWSHRPPDAVQVVEGGDVYRRAPDGVYVAAGAEYTPAPAADQLSLG